MLRSLFKKIQLNLLYKYAPEKNVKTSFNFQNINSEMAHHQPESRPRY